MPVELNNEQRAELAALRDAMDRGEDAEAFAAYRTSRGSEVAELYRSLAERGMLRVWEHPLKDVMGKRANALPVRYVGLTSDGRTYLDDLEAAERKVARERRSDRLHDYKVAAVSVLIGALATNIDRILAFAASALGLS